MTEGPVPDLSPPPVDGCLIPVSSHQFPFVGVCVQISSPYKDPSCVELWPTLMTSFSCNYLLKESISKYSHILQY